MIARLIAFAGVACFVWQWGRRRHDRNPKTQPAAVATWEGEGGALPETGAQLAPAPAQP